MCGSYIKRYTSAQQKWTAEAARTAQERVAAIRTVRAFGHGAREEDNYSHLVRHVVHGVSALNFSDRPPKQDSHTLIPSKIDNTTRDPPYFLYRVVQD